MFIRFRESAVATFPPVETEEFVEMETCLYRWQHGAITRDRAVA
jgi:hypothetical protein